MDHFQKHRFVCGKAINLPDQKKNEPFNQPVCVNNTDAEQNTVVEMIEGMAVGFANGCI